MNRLAASALFLAALLLAANAARAQTPGSDKPAAAKPAETPAAKPAEKAVEKPAAKPADKPADKPDEQKTLYALGLLVGRNLSELSLTKAELAAVEKGISDQVTGAKPKVDLMEYQQKIQEFARKRHEASAAKAKSESKVYLDQYSKEPGAQQLPSGLIFRTLTPGKGPTPAATDKVKVNYEGKLTNGTVFDSSYKRGEPISFPLGGVIKCWTEGVQKMHVGETAQLVCPSDIAYGDRGSPPAIPGGSTLVFKVELLGIEKEK
jgi:FKBP-type peptidyl-prolyl cis-trans isomerase FkpA